MEHLNNNHYSQKILSVILLGVLFIGGCTGPGNSTDPTPTAEAVIEIATATAPPIEETATPEPEPARVILVGSQEKYPQFFQQVQSMLQELAASAGLSFEVRPEIGDLNLSANLGIVVFLGAPADLENLVSSSTQTQFVLVSAQDRQPTENLSVVRLHPDREAFLAGYLSTLIAADWRAGGILPSDSEIGGDFTVAFQNGGRYLCGICATQFSPYTNFPVVAALPAGSDYASWQYGVEELEKLVLYSLYVSPEAASMDMFSLLAGKGIVLVGGQTPPQEMLPLWAATVTQDVSGPLRQVFPGVVNGQGGQVVDASLMVTDVNTELYSEGRQRLVAELIPVLENGAVYTLNVPIE